MTIARLALLGMLPLCVGAAWGAEVDARMSLVLEGGGSGSGNFSVTAGIAWPWSWRRAAGGGEWSGRTEVFVSHLDARVQDERESRTMLGALPLARYRFGGAAANWFAEAGVGLTYMDALYRTEDKQFSTQFNFISSIGVGRSFGARGEQELGLRVSHISNAGIKNPNPGENFLMLRYAHAL